MRGIVYTGSIWAGSVPCSIHYLHGWTGVNNGTEMCCTWVSSNSHFRSLYSAIVIFWTLGSKRKCPVFGGYNVLYKHGIWGIQSFYFWCVLISEISAVHRLYVLRVLILYLFSFFPQVWAWRKSENEDRAFSSDGWISTIEWPRLCISSIQPPMVRSPLLHTLYIAAKVSAKQR